MKSTNKNSRKHSLKKLLIKMTQSGTYIKPLSYIVEQIEKIMNTTNIRLANVIKSILALLFALLIVFQLNACQDKNATDIVIENTNNTSVNITSDWEKDITLAQKNDIDFVYPKELKQFYENQNYAVLRSELNQSQVIENIKAKTLDNDKINFNISGYYTNDEATYIEDAYLNLVGIGNIPTLENEFVKELNQNPDADYLINERKLNYYKLGNTITSIYSVKSFEDSKSTRGHFSEDPLGWPNKNTKIKDHPITAEKTYSGYLWNRSHIVADRFGGEATAVNSTTGTRTQNVGDNSGEGGGMLFMENALANFFEKGAEPFLEICKQTGFIPFIQVDTKIGLENTNNEVSRNIVNLSRAQLKLYAAKSTKYTKGFENQYIDLADTNIETQEIIQDVFDFVYKKEEYSKQNEFYDEILEKSGKSHGSDVVVPNIIKGIEFNYLLKNEVNPKSSNEIVNK